jgi:hypothetical protein
LQINAKVNSLVEVEIPLDPLASATGSHAPAGDATQQPNGAVQDPGNEYFLPDI